MTAAVMGRLTQPPNPVLLELLYEPQRVSDRRHVLPYLLRIDAAHVVMLSARRLLSRGTAAGLLSVNQELGRCLAAGDDVLGTSSPHRGTYFLYERFYVDRLGEQVGGAAHMARSRNDINATVTRMRLRDALLTLTEDACDLLDTTAALATAHVDTLICGFTHLQPAQPTTLGHYLAGVLSEWVRCVEWLDQAFAAVNRSPMGAAAGFGTAFAIDRAAVARLLGFERVVDNAADAVASLDYAARVLSALATLGVSMTRLSSDLQAWASVPYAFFGWPDDLVGTSSIMPQKRNAFVLENVRGLSTTPAGALVNLLLGTKSAPFTNSVEVSLEAVASLWPALESSGKALRLARVLLQSLQVYPERMLSFLGGTQAMLTAVADWLVARHGLAFRTAHDALGRLARDSAERLSADEVGPRLEALIAESTGRRLTLDRAELERRLDPRACVHAARFGGGPSPAVVRRQLRALAGRARRLRARLQRRGTRLKQSETRLAAAAAALRGLPDQES